MGMRRQLIPFEEFKEKFIDQPDGYFPVYSSLQEDDTGKSLWVMQLDMICEWRLTDGKVLFLAVPFDTREQFDEIIAYLKIAAALLGTAIVKRINRLEYPYSNGD